MLVLKMFPTMWTYSSMFVWGWTIFSTSPPSARRADFFEDVETFTYPYEHVFHFGNGQFSQRRPQARGARKLFEGAENVPINWTCFPLLKMGNVLQHRPHHLFLNYFINTKTPEVCLDEIQSPAMRNICVAWPRKNLLYLVRMKTHKKQAYRLTS